MSQSRGVRTLAVDADDVGTTEFKLAEARQQRLLANVRRVAREFLGRFRLEDYMTTFHARPLE